MKFFQNNSCFYIAIFFTNIFFTIFSEDVPQVMADAKKIEDTKKLEDQKKVEDLKILEQTKLDEQKKIEESKKIEVMHPAEIKPAQELKKVEETKLFEEQKIKEEKAKRDLEVKQARELADKQLEEKKLLDERREKEEKEKLEKEKKILEVKKEKEKLEKAKKIAPLTIEEKEVIKKDHDVALTLDTLDVEEEGNWLLKRVWWEQAEATFEKIINLNNEIIKPQMEYFNLRNDKNKSIDSLFRKIGYEHGELNEMLEYFIEEINKEREQEGSLDLSEREFLNLLNEKKAELEQLKIDLASLNDLDSKLEEVMMQVVAQVNKCREYEKSAWNDFKEIGRVLSDKKAKVLFYQMEGYLKNIQNIYDYLTGNLKKYFDGLLANVDELGNSIINKIDTMAKDGLNIKDEFEKIKRREEQREIDKELKRRKEQEQKPKPKGWFQSITDWFKSLYK